MSFSLGSDNAILLKVALIFACRYLNGWIWSTYKLCQLATQKNALVDERECGAGEEDVEDGDPKVDFLCRLLGVLVAGVGEVLPVQRWEEEGGQGQLGPNPVFRGLP